MPEPRTRAGLPIRLPARPPRLILAPACPPRPPARGAVDLGQYGVEPNYFEQNQAEALDPKLTVLDTLVR